MKSLLIILPVVLAAGCSAGSGYQPGKPVDTMKAVQSNPNVPEADKDRAAQDVQRASARAHAAQTMPGSQPGR